jgi:hypothetical protein
MSIKFKEYEHEKSRSAKTESENSRRTGVPLRVPLRSVKVQARRLKKARAQLCVNIMGENSPSRKT